MALYTITINGTGPNTEHLNRSYTIDARTEKEAKEEARRRSGVDPQLRYVPASAYVTTVKAHDFAGQRDDAVSAQQIGAIDREERRAIEQAAKDQLAANKKLDAFQKAEGEEAATTTYTPTFDEFAETYLDPGRFKSPEGTSWTAVKPYSEEVLPPTPIGQDITVDPERKAWLDSLESGIERQIPDPSITDPNVGPPTYQTELSRRQALETGGSFAAFLDELDRAGLGGLQGAAGRFMKSQYQPLYAGYQAEQLMPLMGGGIPFGEDLRTMSDEDRRDYQQALMRQQTGDYTGADDPNRALDESIITAYSPTFGQYARGGLQAGGRQAQQRMGEQLQAMAQKEMGGLAPGSFTSRFLAPESEAQAGFVTQMAEQAQAGRYSPVALRALQGYMPSGGELWANYLRQSTPQVGGDLTAAQGRGMAPPNFAQFVGQQYGLF
jgi:hypothetical protein